MRIGPPCLHVLSKQTTSLSSVDGLLIITFTLFPRSLLGLAVPELGSCLGVSEPHTHTHPHIHCYKKLSHAWWNIDTNAHKFNHNILIHSRGSHGLAGPEIFCLEQVLYKGINKGREEKISKLNECIYIYVDRIDLIAPLSPAGDICPLEISSLCVHVHTLHSSVFTWYIHNLSTQFAGDVSIIYSFIPSP
jgi:hypothetical protein